MEEESMKVKGVIKIDKSGLSNIRGGGKEFGPCKHLQLQIECEEHIPMAEIARSFSGEQDIVWTQWDHFLYRD